MKLLRDLGMSARQAARMESHNKVKMDRRNNHPNYFAPKSSDQPKVPIDFSLRQQLVSRDAEKQLREVLRTAWKHPYIIDRLATLGLEGPVVEAVMQKYGVATASDGQSLEKGKATDSKHSSLRTLFRAWLSARLPPPSHDDGLEDVVTLSGQALQEDVRFSSRIPTPDRAKIVEEARNTISGAIESHAALKQATAAQDALIRVQVVAFLDWYQNELQSMMGSGRGTADHIEYQESTLTSEKQRSNLDEQALARSAASTSASLDFLRSHFSLKRAADLYPAARAFKRKIHLHIGPTNSGKTHHALTRLAQARSGVYLGPLRLLAHEIWERLNMGKIAPDIPPRLCDLRTGEEEKRVGTYVGLTSSTVEMAELSKPVDVAVLDEIQMIGDEYRGHNWTAALLGMPAKELHLCGEQTVVSLIEKLAAECGDDLEIHNYERLTPLQVSDESINGDLGQIRPGDCVVSFGRGGIFALKSRIERVETADGVPLRCAVAYGSLPPETKAEQAKMFNEGVQANVMVASDAVGMGLNLNIKRVIFESMYKTFSGQRVPLSASQIKQIAGRAGRFRTGDDGAQQRGLVCTMYEDDMPILRAGLDAPRQAITRAAIQPSHESIEDISVLLPPLAKPKPTASDQDKASDRSCRSNSSANGADRQLTNIVEDAMRLASISAPEWSRRGHYGSSNALPAVQSNHEEQADSPVFALFGASDVFNDLSLLSSINVRDYFVPDFSQQNFSIPLIRAATAPTDVDLYKSLNVPSLLTAGEMERFATAPIAQRDGSLLKAIAIFARIYAEGQTVPITDVVAKVGILDALTQVEAVEANLYDVWRQRNGKSLYSGADDDAEAEMPTVKELAACVDSNTPFSSMLLGQLESLHRIMSIYSWLFYRFPLAFSDRNRVAALKERTERAIDLTLEGMWAIRAERDRARWEAARKERMRPKARSFDMDGDEDDYSAVRHGATTSGSGGQGKRGQGGRHGERSKAGGRGQPFSVGSDEGKSSRRSSANVH